MKQLFTLLLLTVSFVTNSQNHHHGPWCGTEISHDWMEEFYQRDKSHLNRRSLERRVVPIVYHLLGTDVGTGYFSMPDLLRIHCDLQDALLHANIHFWIREIHYINSSAFYFGVNSSNLFNFHNRPHVLNIFIIQSMTGVCGYSYVPSPPSRPNDGFSGPNWGGIMLAQNCLGVGTTTLIHEAGHYFNLPHTFYGWEGLPAPPANQPAPQFAGFVPTELLDGSNCLEAGDGFCDTPPDYLSDRWNCNTNGLSSSFFRDSNGEQFRIDGGNFMSYSNDACAAFFTNEQYAEMNNTTVTHRAYLQKYASIAPDMSLLEIPQNLFPNNINQIAFGVPLNLEWSKVERAEFYLVQVSLNNNFFNLVHNEVVSDTFFTMPNLQSNRNYSWRVRPFSYAVMCSDFSEAATFSSSNFAAFVDKQDIICFGAKNGQASILPSGITGTLTYKWTAINPANNADVASITNNQISGVNDGTYQAIISNNSNDSLRVFVTIFSSSEIKVNPYQFGSTLSANVSGGTLPYIYSWNNGSNQLVANNPFEGLNDLTIIDAAGCTKTVSVNFNKDLVGISHNSSFLNFSVYPNPTNSASFINVDLELKSAEKIAIQVLNTSGQFVTQNNFSLSSSSNTLQLELPKLARGIYFVKVSIGNDVQVKKISVL